MPYPGDWTAYSFRLTFHGGFKKKKNTYSKPGTYQIH